jgi:hypothetical protein
MYGKLALLIAVLVLVACGSNSGTTTLPPPGVIGAKMLGETFNLTVLSVERKAKLSRADTARQGNTYFVADVLIEATAKTQYNMLFFKAVDADGAEYVPAITLLQDAFVGGQLRPGDKARGKVVFQVPTNTTGLVMSYEPFTLKIGDHVRVKLN